jgi:hypothetical protein
MLKAFCKTATPTDATPMTHKILLTIFSATITTFLYGQDFGSVGTQWFYSENGSGACYGCEYVHMVSVADTVISGKTTHKIERTYYKYNGNEETFTPLYVYGVSDTAFMYNFQKERFQTIFIFNATIGDTLTLDFPEPIEWTTDSTYRLVIDQIDTVITDGVSLKKYRTIELDEFVFWSDHSFMDRIGGLDWFFPRALIFPEAGGPIRCFSDNQIDTTFLTVACDYRLITSLDELNSDNRLKVFPNPVSSMLTIQTPQSVERIELTSMTGQRQISTNLLDINLSNINNGLYILTVYFTTGQLTRTTVIKNGL